MNQTLRSRLVKNTLCSHFKTFSFSFKACCSIEPYEESGHSSSQTQLLNLIYTIEAETYNNLKKFSRVYFGRDTRNRSNFLRKNVSVVTNGLQECQEEIVYIKDNTRDIQNPIRFRLNYTILDNTLPASALDKLDPILDQTQADRTFEATFQKDCGHDGICQSKIDVNAKLSLEKEGIPTFDKFEHCTSMKRIVTNLALISLSRQFLLPCARTGP